MWLYRAYSGNLYHGGEQSTTLPSYTQGDYITCILDMEAKTLSFGKNGEEPKLAFENVEAAELYPCVMFYSTNPGERVSSLTTSSCSYCFPVAEMLYGIALKYILLKIVLISSFYFSKGHVS